MAGPFFEGGATGAGEAGLEAGFVAVGVLDVRFGRPMAPADADGPFPEGTTEAVAAFWSGGGFSEGGTFVGAVKCSLKSSPSSENSKSLSTEEPRGEERGVGVLLLECGATA